MDDMLSGFGFFLSTISIITILLLREEQCQNTQFDIAESWEKTAIRELEEQCLRLRAELKEQKEQQILDFQSVTFEQIQSVLINYPTLKKMIEVKPDLLAKSLISILAPLDNLIEGWGYTAIGSPWEQVPYDPQLHQADSLDISKGELVYVRFVGYKLGGDIVRPAKVSKSLPRIL